MCCRLYNSRTVSIIMLTPATIFIHGAATYGPSTPCLKGGVVSFSFVPSFIYLFYDGCYSGVCGIVLVQFGFVGGGGILGVSMNRQLN